MRNGQNGRRRGRGGPPRVPGQVRQPDMGNRMEVRVRGNAHQLLEKYKQLARDASQAGDRVAAEYYLQHADHYFRVLSEFRQRQEEQRPRGYQQNRYEDEGDDEGFEAAEPLRVAEMTPIVDALPPSVRTAPRDDEGDDREASDAPEAEAAEEIPEDRPRRRRRTRGRREDGAAPEMATVDA